MLTLLILRHAKAEQNSPSGRDHDRPLADRGRNDAAHMGKALRKLALLPGHVISSDSARTRETAEHFLEKCHYDGPVAFLSELYHAAPTAIVDVVRRQETKSPLLVIGHNPGLEQLAADLAGAHEGSVVFPTSALARIDFEIDDWSQIENGSGSLMFLLNPAVVDKL